MPGVYLGEGLYRIQFEDLVEFYLREEDIIGRLELRKILKNKSLYEDNAVVEEFNSILNNNSSAAVKR